MNRPWIVVFSQNVESPTIQGRFRLIIRSLWSVKRTASERNLYQHNAILSVTLLY